MTTEALAAARLYLCTDSRREQGDLPEFLDAVLSSGVDIVQLREKNLEAADELALLEVFADACRRHGKLLAVNDRADLAVLAGADVLHVGQRDLTPAQARRIVGGTAVGGTAVGGTAVGGTAVDRRVAIGLSSHSVEQATAAAAAPDVDYFCVGPVWRTPTKPGRPHTGLGPIRAVADSAAGAAKPWFAIGGIDLRSLDDVLDAGAARVVVVRAITEASDPAEATRLISARLAERAQRSAASGAGAIA